MSKNPNIHRQIDLAASPADSLAGIPDLGPPGDPRNRDVIALLRIAVHLEDDGSRRLVRRRAG